MTTVTLEEAKRLLEELQKQLCPGSSIIIVRDGEPLAQLTPVVEPSPNRPTLGFWMGKIEIISEDDEHLRDFAEYM